MDLVLGNCQTIVGMNKGRILNKSADIILKSTDRLIALVNDMLDVSRIESGRFTITMKSIDLVNVKRTVSHALLQN